MAIHVIQSQRIDVLLDSMLRIVNQTARNPFEVLQTRHFIVPSPAVETWLTQKIAEKKALAPIPSFITGFAPFNGLPISGY